MNHPLESDTERFEKELLATIPRYISKPGAKVNIRARHNETHEVIPFAVGYPDSFATWKTVQSLADRRSVIYSLLDGQFLHKLELWQIIERYNDDRYAEKALQFATDLKEETDEQDPNYWNALAKTNFILTNYTAAEENCEKAKALDPDNLRTRRIYADILHYTQRAAKAHEIYLGILNQKLPKNKPMQLPVQELLGFDGDILNSPVYAFDWLKADANNNDATWAWANEEFYYSPHFRSQYAFYLIEKEDAVTGFVKLLSLSKEMPWFKDAVVNSHNLIGQLNLTESLKDEKARLETIMAQKKWN